MAQEQNKHLSAVFKYPFLWLKLEFQTKTSELLPSHERSGFTVTVVLYSTYHLRP